MTITLQYTRARNMHGRHHQDTTAMSPCHSHHHFKITKRWPRRRQGQGEKGTPMTTMTTTGARDAAPGMFFIMFFIIIILTLFTSTTTAPLPTPSTPGKLSKGP